VVRLLAQDSGFKDLLPPKKLAKHLRCPGNKKKSKVPCLTIDLLPRVSKRLIKVHIFPFEKYN
jgi:hypothetical protein